MSIEVVLIPAAIAGFSAWQARRAAGADGREVVAVSTRMRDGGLLQRALADTGATVEQHGDVLTATWPDSQGRFTRDEQGIWSAHLAGEVDHETATALVGAIDVAYGRHVQQEVLARLRERAPQAGMHVESETTEDDDSVTLVLNVDAGSRA